MLSIIDDSRSYDISSMKHRKLISFFLYITLKYTDLERNLKLHEVHSIDLKVCVLALVSVLFLTIKAMPQVQGLGLGVDFMTCPDGNNLACMAVSSPEVIHVSMMVHMFSSSSIDCNIYVLLIINLALLDNILC